MDVIAERHLELRVDGNVVAVSVKIGLPLPGQSAEDWLCPYEIHFGDHSKSTAMHGVDSLQALQLTIAALDSELEKGARKRGGTLYYYDEPFKSVLENSGLEVRQQ